MRLNPPPQKRHIFFEFLEAFVPQLACEINRRQVEFLDKELIWIRRRLPTRKYVDLVAKVKWKGRLGFILVHVEHQGKRDPGEGRNPAADPDDALDTGEG